MKTIEVELIGDAVNATVVRLPTRRFPGVVIQGDSLAILHAMTETVAASMAKGDIAEAREAATELRDLLASYRHAYEAQMKAAGLELPYPPR